LKELKFMVWDKVRQQMFKPQAISFDIQSLAPFAVSVPRRSWEPVGKFELLQWTGLCDENGVDIYEGDFIRISSILYNVVWNKPAASFELIDITSSLKHDMGKVASGTVIGNQFQNADLYSSNSAIVVS
jgi:hypothetical protein